MSLEYPIIIVGCGIAGLVACRNLLERGANVTILEGRDRPGGRIHSIHSDIGIVEAGAEFIHGELPLTLQLLRDYQIDFHETEGEMLQVENDRTRKTGSSIDHWGKLLKSMKRLDNDIPFAEFLSKNFEDPIYDNLRKSATRFAEGFDLADTRSVSTFALYREWEADDDEPQFRIGAGYGALVDALMKDCMHRGAKIEFSSIVNRVDWQKGKVRLFTRTGKEYLGSKLLLTIPMGVLQSSIQHPTHIRFSPAIAQTTQVHNVGFGYLIKVVLECAEPFWQQKSKNAGFFFSDEIIPTWWTQLPKKENILTGWLGGSGARALASKSDHAIAEICYESLAGIFEKSQSHIESSISKTHVFNWSRDPFSLGGYSFPTLQSTEARKLIGTPVENTIFFAGEALYDGKNGGTVEAAISSAMTASGLIQN